MKSEEQKTGLKESGIHLANIRYPAFDSADGLSLEVYLAGCDREPKCQGCHNPELWEKEPYAEYSPGEIKDKVLEIVQKPTNLVILGGEPLDQDQDALLDFILKTKESSLIRSVWLYTSYSIFTVSKEIKSSVDYIKTGRYKRELPGDRLPSANQKMFRKTGIGWKEIWR